IVPSAESFDCPLFVANELFDAIPCDLLQRESGAYSFGMLDEQKFAFVPLSALCGAEAEVARQIVAIAKRFSVVRGEIPLGYAVFGATPRAANALGILDV
ncbi:MAG: SAM-dependent methyltransferase, partial [Helicobacter sp.]|nr:SAM-dependent methyltransferase [Helicobacter sp.]